ncbi:hypothetical protein [Acinetobacter shaoyimingii]|uniref:Uncharacterized protein n=1 Tax=Acinetobacter shaoyimingii TaxID=2715164 RepID=A0A6G8RSW7_9GAMM|nr:hypothetical protein [Acinetobacter shaoyimingii]NHB56687.1 hypothetical protein [Acinetobacter shaoyimingii]QIO04813.1 hypothetical protein G8E00_01945 [Acinetobacter shaoyimingii]
MLSQLMNHKIKISFGMLMLVITAIIVAIASSNAVSDGISISVATVLSFGILAIIPFIVLDTIHSICNP